MYCSLFRKEQQRFLLPGKPAAIKIGGPMLAITTLETPGKVLVPVPAVILAIPVVAQIVLVDLVAEVLVEAAPAGAGKIQ